MKFKLYLEATQDDMQFMREYFHDKLNPDNLLVWADYKEERGENEKAEILRQGMEDYVIKFKKDHIRQVFNWPKSKQWHAYSLWGTIKCATHPLKIFGRIEDGAYELNLKTGEWEIQPIEIIPGSHKGRPIEVEKIPDEVLIEVFLVIAQQPRLSISYK